MQSPSFNIFQVLILLGSLNGITWAILIFCNHNKKQGSVYLGFFVLTFALASLKIILQEKILNFNRYLPVPLLYQFAFGPLLYLYTKTTLTGGRLKPAQLLLFLPSLLLDLLPSLLLFFCGYGSHENQIEKWLFIGDILAFAAFGIFTVASWAFARRHKQDAPKWMGSILFLAIAILVSWLLYILSVLLLKGKWLFGAMPYYPVYLVLCCCTYGIGVIGYYRPEAGLLKMPVAKKRKVIPVDNLDQKKGLLLAKIREHAWHHDENLDLQTLSRHLQIPASELSYIINTEFGKNFSGFINTLRIDDIKEKMADPGNKKYTVLGLAYEVGFNSKASFYRAFKKETNTTPAEYFKTET